MTKQTYNTKGRINEYILGVIGGILKNEGKDVEPCERIDCIMIKEHPFREMPNTIHRDGIELELICTKIYKGYFNIPDGRYCIYQLSGYVTLR